MKITKTNKKKNKDKEVTLLKTKVNGDSMNPFINGNEAYNLTLGSNFNFILR